MDEHPLDIADMPPSVVANTRGGGGKTRRAMVFPGGRESRDLQLLGQLCVAAEVHGYEVVVIDSSPSPFQAPAESDPR